MGLCATSPMSAALGERKHARAPDPCSGTCHECDRICAIAQRVLPFWAGLGNDPGRTGGGGVRTPVVAAQLACIALSMKVLLNMDRAPVAWAAVTSPNF